MAAASGCLVAVQRRSCARIGPSPVGFDTGGGSIRLVVRRSSVPADPGRVIASLSR